VVRAARGLFGSINHGVLDSPRLKLHLADGKSFVTHARGSYDLVLSESTYPFLSGSSGLYTLDYFERCGERLAPGGMVSIWLPLDIPAEGVRSIVRTFCQAFAHATLWTTSGYGYKHALLLGSAEPIRIDYAHLRARTSLPAISELLATVGIETVEEFIAGMMLDRAGLVRYAGPDAALHTDDRPVLEYQTSLRSGAQWRLRLARNLQELAQQWASLSEMVALPQSGSAGHLDAADALERGHRVARTTLAQTVARLRTKASAIAIVARARSLRDQGRIREAAREYRRALDLCPSDEAIRLEAGLLELDLNSRPGDRTHEYENGPIW
jgi:hypothetical protein